MVGVGDEPTSPLTTTPLPVAPVTAELPRTPNCAAAPSGGATWAHVVEGTQRSATNPRYAPRCKASRFISIDLPFSAFPSRKPVRRLYRQKPTETVRSWTLSIFVQYSTSVPALDQSAVTAQPDV